MRTRSILLALALLAPAPTLAAGGPFGAGIILGEPSGLSFKLFLDKSHAVDAALDFSFVHDKLYIHADYLFHIQTSIARHGLYPYLGIGGRILVFERHGDDKGDLAARFPFGITWMPRSVPIDVFLEPVILLELYPELDPGIEAGIGVRYYF